MNDLFLIIKVTQGIKDTTKINLKPKIHINMNKYTYKLILSIDEIQYYKYVRELIFN